jgi:alkylation response protein AidB-like acyl-CoA dehydrogenase
LRLGLGSLIPASNGRGIADPMMERLEDDLAGRVAALLGEHPPSATPRAEFLGAQFDAGIAWVHFPVGHGGLGYPAAMQRVVRSLLDAAGAPDGQMMNTTGYGQGAATIVMNGTEEQKSRYLRPLFTCEEVWCQLFSEPGSGSDLAGLSTRAVRDGDGWVVTGQKVWTTRGHLAHRGLLLARTDPDVEKHAGLTYFICDMRAAGVEVRPLRQMTGDGGFNEVFLTGVFVPDRDRVGEVGQGWAVSNTTLANERTGIAGGAGASGRGALVADALETWRRLPDRNSKRAGALRDQLMCLWVDAEVNRLTSMRAVAMRAAGAAGPEGSIGKLAGAVLSRRVAAFTVGLLGPEGTLYGSYEMRQPTYGLMGPEPEAAPDPCPIPRRFVASPSASLAGGTDDIQRNIIAERVLGLPRDIAVDRGMPWSQVRHN